MLNDGQNSAFPSTRDIPVYSTLVKVSQKMNAPRFHNIMLKTKTVGARVLPEGIEVMFAPAEEGGTAPAPQVYDLVLQAVGRTPNGKKLLLEVNRTLWTTLEQPLVAGRFR